MKIDPSQIIIPSDLVLVDIGVLYDEKISGTEIYSDITFEPEKHVKTTGKVVSIPKKLVFNPGVPITPTNMPWETVIEVSPGDDVYFNFDPLFTSIVRYNRHFLYEGRQHVFIPYRDIYCAVRDGKVIPCNGYCIISAVREDDIPRELRTQVSNLIITNRGGNVSPNFGRVEFVGRPNDRYLTDWNRSDSGADISPGDLIMFSRHADKPMQYTLHRSFMGKKQLYVIQRALIKAKIYENNSRESADVSKSA